MIPRYITGKETFTNPKDLKPKDHLVKKALNDCVILLQNKGYLKDFKLRYENKGKWKIIVNVDDLGEVLAKLKYLDKYSAPVRALDKALRDGNIIYHHKVGTPDYHWYFRPFHCAFGILGSGVETVTGIYQVITKPVQTATNLVTAVSHPIETISAIGKTIAEDHIKAAEEGHLSTQIGKDAGEIMQIILLAKVETKVATSIGKVGVKVGSKAAKVVTAIGTNAAKKMPTLMPTLTKAVAVTAKGVQNMVKAPIIINSAKVAGAAAKATVKVAAPPLIIVGVQPGNISRIAEIPKNEIGPVVTLEPIRVPIKVNAWMAGSEVKYDFTLPDGSSLKLTLEGPQPSMAVTNVNGKTICTVTLNYEDKTYVGSAEVKGAVTPPTNEPKPITERKETPKVKSDPVQQPQKTDEY